MVRVSFGRNNNSDIIVPTLTHPIITILVQHKMIKLWEVDSKYDIDQILQLYEIAMFDNINKFNSMNRKKQNG